MGVGWETFEANGGSGLIDIVAATSAGVIGGNWSGMESLPTRVQRAALREFSTRANSGSLTESVNDPRHAGLSLQVSGIDKDVFRRDRSTEKYCEGLSVGRTVLVTVAGSSTSTDHYSEVRSWERRSVQMEVPRGSSITITIESRSRSVPSTFPFKNLPHQGKVRISFFLSFPSREHPQ